MKQHQIAHCLRGGSSRLSLDRIQVSDAYHCVQGCWLEAACGSTTSNERAGNEPLGEIQQTGRVSAGIARGKREGTIRIS